MIIKAIIFSILLYFSTMAYLYFTQNSKIFNFSFVEKVKPKILNRCKKCKEVKLKVNGAILDGVFKDENSSKLIIYFGGNADDATYFIKYTKDLNGFDIITFNYRGNGLSSSKPNEKKLLKDALKIYDTYSKNREIYIVGRSLGSGIATYVASKRKVKGVLLITPYDSIENIAKGRYPFFPISLLLKYKFNSYKFVQNVNAPVSVFMVKDDKTVPNQRTVNLIKHIKNISCIKIFKDATHANILEEKNFPNDLKTAILKF